MNNTPADRRGEGQSYTRNDTFRGEVQMHQRDSSARTLALSAVGCRVVSVYRAVIDAKCHFIGAALRAEHLRRQPVVTHAQPPASIQAIYRDTLDRVLVEADSLQTLSGGLVPECGEIR
ncbi:hypothetical protein FHS27_003251 [Rhodopirellula rubra]|uniref:Uncharacterized protein n=1 Tax=Aporhodopirellula rubra TaxID=980271 RepID=A0A7W5H6Y0_9BACT|nr:hypothetical protein [Aporhodopirellula rubra]